MTHHVNKEYNNIVAVAVGGYDNVGGGNKSEEVSFCRV